MSTFCGRMEEMAYISIDNFKDDNLKSHAFFLSHCHWDHMKGIDSRDFECALQKNNAYLYMSDVSKTILEKIVPYLSCRIKVLGKGKNFIDIPNCDKTIVVTMIPAGHCPGSVMFLFESDKILLYTGDIRIRAKELQKFNQLYDSTGILKRIDNIYLDTTFFLKCFKHFPLREDSITEFCKLINDWLEKDKENFVQIQTPANYGSEYLFIEISKRCKQPIHVNEKKYDVYKNFPELDEAISLEKNTRVHNDFCFTTMFSTPNKLTIKPSALCWRNLEDRNGIVEKRGETYHVCYSSHSSYTELIDILKLLKPLKISPSVMQDKEKDNEEMMNNITEVLEEIHKKEESSEDDTEFQDKINWSNNDNIVKNCREESNEENKEFFNFLDSPPRSKKQKV